MAINILDCPAEILQHILLFTVLNRGVKRGLRLRLVCKVFADLTKYAVYQSLLLDHFYAPDVGYLWQIKNHHGAETFWHKYLVQRVLTEKDSAVGRYVDIREVAQQICEELGSGSDLRATVQRLCWLALDGKTTFPGRPRARSSSPREPYDDSPKYDPKLSLLSAAAHFSLMDLVDRLLSEGHCPTSCGDLFPPAMQVAAMDGNANMLERFQQHLPEYEELLGFHEWRGKAGPCSVIGAALRGDMDILSLALYPPSRTTIQNKDYAGQVFGEIGTLSPVGRTLRKAQRRTNNPEMFDFIDKFFKESMSVTDLYTELIWYSRAGVISMVRYLLAKGVPVHNPLGYARPVDPPLVEACKGGHDEIVDLLLQHGADPNYGADRMWPHTALPMAASSGSLTIVRRLLDHGACVNELTENLENLPAIWYAIAIEHTQMVELLLARGANLYAGGDVETKTAGWMAESALEMALELGMDSMADILRGHGIMVTSPMTNSGYAPWKRWPMLITASNFGEWAE
ncbi:ankyrin [Coniochaeta ligniaria NRRL 30616]|uniref:Ankyrin n=1 Tax=Coniochaeta ligniaria NRRL 30616 TaxID=1408157 RepID=A0A1J7JAS6_9PEZI|nr:ankyrin [Coniochaeta ligniaria NRRL 30616]